MPHTKPGYNRDMEPNAPTKQGKYGRKIFTITLLAILLTLALFFLSKSLTTDNAWVISTTDTLQKNRVEEINPEVKQLEKDLDAIKEAAKDIQTQTSAIFQTLTKP